MANESSQLRQEIRFGLQTDKLEFAKATATLQMKESMSVSDKIETTDDSMMALSTASGDITTEGQFQPAEGELNWVPSRPATGPEDLVLSSIYNEVSSSANVAAGVSTSGSNTIAYSPGPISPQLFSGQVVSPKKLQIMLGTVFSGEEFEAGSSQGLTEHKTNMMYSRAFDLETSKVLSVVFDSGSSGDTVITMDSVVGSQLAAFEPFNGSNQMKYRFVESDLTTDALAAFDITTGAASSSVGSFSSTGSTITFVGDKTGDVSEGDYFQPVPVTQTLASSSSYFQDNHSNLDLFLNMRTDGSAMSETDLLATTAVSFFDKVSYKFDNAIEFRGGFVGSSKTLTPFYTDSGNTLEGEIMLPLISSNSHFKSASANFNALDIVLRMTTGSDVLTYYIPDAHRKEVSSEIGSAYDGLTIPYKGQGLANNALCKISKFQFLPATG